MTGMGVEVFVGGGEVFVAIAVGFDVAIAVGPPVAASAAKKGTTIRQGSVDADRVGLSAAARADPSVATPRARPTRDMAMGSARDGFIDTPD